MNDDIDDAFPERREDYPTVAIIKRETCGETGEMYSTGEPRKEQYWDCEACGTDDAKHTLVMSTDSGREVGR